LRERPTSLNPLAFALLLLRTYTSAVALGRQTMFQIVESVVSTLTKFTDAHGPKVVIGVLGIVGVGIVLKILHRVLTGRGPDHG
jgi:hypothetical protein